MLPAFCKIWLAFFGANSINKPAKIIKIPKAITVHLAIIIIKAKKLKAEVNYKVTKNKKSLCFIVTDTKTSYGDATVYTV